MSYFKKSVRVSPADKWFSIYIRLRDAGSDGVCQCCTCYRSFSWRDMTCGHFQKRHHAGTRFNEQNCAAQCVSCNGYHDGEQYKHGRYIDKKYGEGTADKLQALAWSHGVVHKHEEKLLAKIFRDKARNLAEGKGLTI